MNKKRILIVEDNLILTLSLRDFLSLRGYKNVELAKTYSEAISLLEEKEFDIVYLDVMLIGKKTGIDVAEYIRSKNMNVTIFYLSAMNSFPEIKKQMLETNPEYIFSKPVNMQDILNKLRQV